MKQVILNLSQRKPADTRPESHSRISPRSPRAARPSGRRQEKKATITKPPSTFEPAERDENIHKPAPTTIVSV